MSVGVLTEIEVCMSVREKIYSQLVLRSKD